MKIIKVPDNRMILLLYRQKRGRMEQHNYAEQRYAYSPQDTGGLSHKNYSLTAGMQYQF